MQTKRLMKMKDARAFLTPVDPIADNCSDYLTVIQRPMCLNDVLHRLQNGSYAHAHEFAADVRLTFENAKTYNANKHPVHAAARRLLKTFDDHFAKLQLPRPSPSAAAAKLVNVKGKANLGSRDAGAKGERLKDAEAVEVAQDAGNALSYRRSATRWLCPHHRCVHSNRPASDCGGMLFRCYDCPAAFSDDYLEDGFVPVDTSDAFRPLNYAPPTSAEYIRCVKCAVALANASLVPPGEKPAEEEEESASLTDSASAEEQAEAELVKGTDRSRRGGVGGRHGVVGGIDSDQVSKRQRRGRGRDMAQFQESSSGKEQSDGWADSGWEKDLEEDAEAEEETWLDGGRKARPKRNGPRLDVKGENGADKKKGMKRETRHATLAGRTGREKMGKRNRGRSPSKGNQGVNDGDGRDGAGLFARLFRSPRLAAKAKSLAK